MLNNVPADIRLSEACVRSAPTILHGEERIIDRANELCAFAWKPINVAWRAELKRGGEKERITAAQDLICRPMENSLAQMEQERSK
ncbi:unnamed protein product [Pleuronectes platessa]|uniref:Uncharacterized protein n=1 Tax=Pleuronectes platessa TaxID=8262 RepID=A0A9N7Z0E4_PLEPL|nr:unnamed protein product [Pleuronectes platessa]